MDTAKNGIRIGLAASGGGHVRQLLDLEPAWGGHDHFFITEDTALGRSIAKDHRTHFVDHVALGQARLGRPGAMVRAAARNLVQSIRAIRQERPDILISTGAGAVFFASLAARLPGAPFILIDSFARFQEPSAFARIAKPFASTLIVQSAALKAHWPKALLFDPLRLIDAPPPAKEELIFVTVGATLGFDRMVDAVARLKKEGVLRDHVIFQIGSGSAPDGLPPDTEVVRDLSFSAVGAILQRARIVVTHGGTGSLITALRAGCNVIAMPRAFQLGEHYDDHQTEITGAFVARGRSLRRIMMPNWPPLETARTRTPTLATTDPTALNDYLADRLRMIRR